MMAKEGDNAFGLNYMDALMHCFPSHHISFSTKTRALNNDLKKMNIVEFSQ